MNNKSYQFIRQFAQNRILQHILFWAVSFYILLRFFAYQNEIYTSDIIYSGLFHLSLVVVVYVNLLVLIPFLLQKNRILLYLIAVALLLFLGIQLNQWIFNDLSDWIFSGYYFISYYEFLDLLYFFLIYWVMSTLLKFSKAWFVLAETRQKLIQLQSAKLQAELDGLKNQINPHFLFNALNNIYALALDNEKQTPTAILKLSEVLRYILYESNTPEVLLTKEVKYIQDYIELQKMRLESYSTVDFIIENNIKSIKIAPLLLISFVENSFKHGVKNDKNAPIFKINLTVDSGLIIFKIKNKKEISNELDENTKGIGLENVKRRLALIYPNRHSLTIDNQSDSFEVILKINTQNEI
jgi:sensor histidine kinase YesM